MIFAIRFNWRAHQGVGQGIRTIYADANSPEEASALFDENIKANRTGESSIVEDVEILPTYNPTYHVDRHMISASRKKELSLVADLTAALKEAINFIEVEQAIRGSLHTEESWDKAVADYKKGSVSRIGIGRCYVDKASVELKAANDLIAYAEAVNMKKGKS